MKRILGIIIIIILSISLYPAKILGDSRSDPPYPKLRLMDITIPYPKTQFNHTDADNKINDTGIIEWEQKMLIYSPQVGEFNVSIAIDAFLSFKSDETIKPNATINLTSEILPRESHTELYIMDVQSLLIDALDPIIGEYLPVTIGNQEISFQTINDAMIGIDPIIIDEILGLNTISKTIPIPVLNWTIMLTFTIRTSVWVFFRIFENGSIQNYWPIIWHEEYGSKSLLYRLPVEIEGENKITLEAGYGFSLDSLKISTTIAGEEIIEDSEIKLSAVNVTKKYLFWEPTVSVWLASANLYIQISNIKSNQLFDLSFLTPLLGIVGVMGYRIWRKRKKNK
ncbi:hypothetical protein CEE45_16665 [Candidatus Heimdallarchaeota archaeon B3_Heim]|nr:MAG: hypothetical protein CEE45_16665 [Candidatus Heimdallarchaeota archaeon B3_Heim]